MLASAVGPDTITNPDALVEGGFVGATGGPDPTTILFITLDIQTSTTIADIATLLFCTSLFAAMLSFHNSVARYFFALGRARVLPAAFGRTNRMGAPYVGSLAQSLIAAVIVFIFWQSDSDPVLQLFTWLTNLGALGVIALLALASFAVVGYFARNPHEESMWTSRYRAGDRRRRADGDLHPRPLQLQHADHRPRSMRRLTTGRSSCPRS